MNARVRSALRKWAASIANEPPLEQMAGRAGVRVHERGEAPMRLPHRPGKGVRVGGGQDEMNVVGHEAIGPAGDAVGVTALGEQVAI